MSRVIYGDSSHLTWEQLIDLYADGAAAITVTATAP